MIAVVGPLTSLAVGGVAVGALVRHPRRAAALAVEGLAGANLLVGVLNLVPGLPLDGGRVLKAAVWGVTGNVHRGTIVAGWGGRVTAVAVLGWPLLQVPITRRRAATLLDFVLAFVIALFLWTGATAAMASARLRRRLPEPGRPRPGPAHPHRPRRPARWRGRPPRPGGRRPAASSPSPATRPPARRRQRGGAARHPRGPAPLGGRLDRRPHPRARGSACPPTIAGEDLILAISRRPATEYLLVEDDGTIYGVLATADVDEAFRAPRR